MAEENSSYCSMNPTSSSDAAEKSSVSADAVGANDDLLTEILLRLPAKSLTQFKSVAHRWLSLVSDPQFSLDRARRSSSSRPVSGLFLHGSRTKPEFSFVPFHDSTLRPSHFQFLAHPGTTILHSSNGLLCYSKSEQGENGLILGYYVCNPTTKQSARIPLMGLIHNRRIRRGSFRVQHKLCNIRSQESAEIGSELNINLLGVYVAFDPLISNQYRVVCVWECNASIFNYEVKIAVYKSETGSWGEPVGPFTVPYALRFDNGAFWNGRTHWISNTYIVGFDIDGGYIRVASLPLDSESWSVVYFGVSRDHLYLVVNDRANNGYGVLNVLEMERDYSGWVAKYCYDLDPALVNMVYNYLPHRFSPIFLGSREKEDESCLILASSGELISYNLKQKTSEKLCDLPLPSYELGWTPVAHYKAFPYEETLLEVS